MNNRNEILHEYHDLIKKLNTSNKLKNQTTELHFFEKLLPDGKIYLCVAVNSEKFLSMGLVNKNNYLVIDNDFEYQKFAQYLRESIKYSDDLNLAIRRAINRLFTV
jgi:hypothetical protein